MAPRVKIRNNGPERYCEVWVDGQPILGPDGKPSRYCYSEWFAPAPRMPTDTHFNRLAQHVVAMIQC